MTIRIGTASWTDKSLIASKRFYPRGCSSAEERLRFYASQFPLVEVDSSYYAMPNPSNSMLWAERTPPNFQFNVKAFRLFTGHQTPVVALDPDVRTALGPTPKKNVYYRDVPRELRDELWLRFRDALRPLRDAGKLKAVHFQYAPWVTFGREWREHIDDCIAHLPGQLLAVEFRHQSWFTERHTPDTLAFERERGLVNVVVDEPNASANSIPGVWEVTNPELAVVRLHGRNHETWNVKDAKSSSDRFNYDYSDAELAALGGQITALARKVDLVQVVFNNNHEDQGQRNARTLGALLR